MKNLFYLFATILFSFHAIAQDKNAAIQNLLKTSMVGLVDNAKPYYKDGMTYNQFLSAVSDSKSFSKEENAVATDVYNFLASKTGTGEIFAKYDGKSLKALAANGSSNVPVVANKCGWKCWLEAVIAVIEVVIEIILAP